MTERNIERAATFEFARRLAEPGFRKILATHGCRDVQDVVVAVDGTPVIEVLERIFTRARPPALVAVRREHHEHGFVFVMVEPAIQRTARAADDKTVSSLSEATSIGMLYDTLPAVQGTTFEIGGQWTYHFQPVDQALAAA